MTQLCKPLVGHAWLVAVTFKHGNSAVHYAAKGGHLDVVKYLKQHDVDMNIQNDNVWENLYKVLVS